METSESGNSFYKTGFWQERCLRDAFRMNRHPAQWPSSLLISCPCPRCSTGV